MMARKQDEVSALSKQLKPPYLLSASWISLTEGVVNFRHDWLSGDRPSLYWGEDQLPLLSLHRAPLIDFANHSGYFVDRGKFHFALRGDRFPDINLKKEKVYVVGEFNNWAAAIGDPKWRLQPRVLRGEKYYVLDLPKADIDGSKPMAFKFVTHSGNWLEVPADATNVIMDSDGNRNYRIRPHRTGRHRFYFKTPHPLSKSAGAHLVFKKRGYVESTPMQPGVFLKQLRSDLPLGPEVYEDRSIFRLFAPRASKVQLYLYDDEKRPDAVAQALSTQDGLVWEVTVPGDCDGLYYYYGVDGDEQDGFGHFDKSFKVLDPYAKACVGPLGPGIVVSDRRFPPIKKPFTPPPWHELVIVEVHLRDLLGRAPINLSDDARLGYRGLTAWLKEETCYLRELGVNAVELQPIHEFDTVKPEDYGWGYMPVNYFSPASHYAEDSTRGTQIEEFRAVVNAFHEAGLAVVLDVVYNHYGNPNYLQFIDKDYYFMLSPDGEYMNYSGCGNTIDPDTPMSRRLMADSLRHFIEAYDVDGFRFDLGELLGIDCLRYLEHAVKRVKPSAFLTAEPWSFRSHLGGRMMETGVSAWNDGFREFVRKYVRGEGDTDGLSYFLRGSAGNLAAFPAQTVNYLCSHDDRVWIDKVTENRDFNGTHPTPNDRRRTHLALAILLCSSGIPMLHGGIDFLYSKGGKNNTYLDGETNKLPYTRRQYFSSTHAYCRAWILFRQSVLGKRLLCLDGHPQESFYKTWSLDNALVLLVNADKSAGDAQLVFAVNSGFDRKRIPLDNFEFTGFRQWADHERFVEGGLPTVAFYSSASWLEMPGLSCGLWISD